MPLAVSLSKPFDVRCSSLPLLLLLSFAPTARAEVFMRLGGGAAALEQLGGTPLHRADVRINGQPGTLAAFGFETPPEQLAPDLRKALQLPAVPSGASTLVTRVADGRATSLLLLPGNSPRRSVAILIEQTAEARRKAQAAPASWPAGLQCPDADLLFSAENEHTRTALAVASTRTSPEAARRRLEGVLAAGGWARASPVAANSGFALFSRGNRVCLVCALPDGSGGARIALLQRLGTAP